MAVGPKPFPSEPPPTRQKTEYDLSSSADADDDLYSRLKNAATPARIYRDTGGVREGRAEEPTSWAAAVAGGGEANSISSAGHRTIYGDDRSKQRHRRIYYRVELLRSDPKHNQLRAPQTLCFCRSALPF
ncbi:hypothetical protein OROHE_021038 [Orobanche hederae]